MIEVKSSLVGQEEGEKAIFFYIDFLILIIQIYQLRINQVSKCISQWCD